LALPRAGESRRGQDPGHPSGCTLPFEDGAFDLMLSDFVFEHVQNPEQVSAKLARILDLAGWLCPRQRL